MKTNIKTMAMSVLALTLLLSSCSIEKRHYLSGYSVQWNHGKNKIKSNADTENKLANLELKLTTEQKSVVDDKAKTLTASLDNKPVLLPVSNSLDLPIKSNKKAESIVYHKNKSGQVFETKTNVKAVKKIKNEQASATLAGGTKSWVVALLLCVFLGLLGIHRFYLGYPLIGILELLTGGLFGILWIIDLILIIFRALKPKDGDYN
jgi:TM2 domain-containing membrane protein YozV